MKLGNIVLVLTLILAGACSDNPEKLKKQYIKACSEENFDKARDAVEKIKPFSDYLAMEGIKYVNDKEIYSRLANPSRDNDSRILYLYNTYEKYELPDMTDVLEVTVSTGNENLASRLIRGGVTPNLTVAKSAISIGSHELFELILKDNPDLIANEEVSDYYISELGKEKFHDFLNNAINKTIKEETMSSIASLSLQNNMIDVIDNILLVDYRVAFENPYINQYVKNKDTYNKIIAEQIKKSIFDISNRVPSFHSQGIVDYYEGRDYSVEPAYSGDKPKYKMPKENQAIKDFNDKLMILYNDARKIGRPDVALQVLNAMRPTIEAYPGTSRTGKPALIKGYKVDGDHYLIYHNYDEINRLKEDLKKGN